MHHIKITLKNSTKTFATIEDDYSVDRFASIRKFAYYDLPDILRICETAMDDHTLHYEDCKSFLESMTSSSNGQNISDEEKKECQDIVDNYDLEMKEHNRFLHTLMFFLRFTECLDRSDLDGLTIEIV